eukprot:scaffold5901_cov116-Cylindrotheca_fusiformis.AAC.5
MDASELPWRLDPHTSYSDWTVTVTILGDGSSARENDLKAVPDVYHVHKTFLSCGPRKSTFFHKVFQSEDSSYKKSNTTRLNLEKSAAALFPEFLDYVYGSELSLTPESAVVLHSLSDYLGVNSLKNAVLDYARNDLLSKQFYSRNHLKCSCCSDEAKSDVDSVALEACMKSANRWDQVRAHLLSSDCDRTSLVDLMTNMLTLEQKNLLFFYALQERPSPTMTTSSGRSDIRLRRLEKEQRQDQKTQKEEVARVVAELAAMKEKVETLENQNEAYCHAFSTLKSECHELQTKNEELRRRTQELDEVEANLASMMAKNESNERLLVKLKAHTDDLEKMNSRIKEDNESTKEIISTLKSSKEKLEKKLSKAREKLQNQAALASDESAKLKQIHLAELSRVKGDSAKITYQYQNEIARVNEESIKLKRQCELLEELYWTGIGR